MGPLRGGPLQSEKRPTSNLTADQEEGGTQAHRAREGLKESTFLIRSLGLGVGLIPRWGWAVEKANVYIKK